MGWLEVATTTRRARRAPEQPTEDDRVADVADEQLVEAQHANFLRKRFRQRLQRIGVPLSWYSRMYPAHEVVKVLAARRHGNASVEDVHQACRPTGPQVTGRRAVNATPGGSLQ